MKMKKRVKFLVIGIISLVALSFWIAKAEAAAIDTISFTPTTINENGGQSTFKVAGSAMGQVFIDGTITTYFDDGRTPLVTSSYNVCVGNKTTSAFSYLYIAVDLPAEQSKQVFKITRVKVGTSAANLSTNLTITELTATASFNGEQYIQNSKIKVVVDLTFGGAITKIIPLGNQPHSGQNLVDNFDSAANAFDPGRLVQCDFYAAGENYPGFMSSEVGYNPTQAGNKYKYGSPTIAYRNTGTMIYTKAIPLEWNPDNKGGGPLKPIASDVYFEQWISLDGAAIKYEWKVTNLSSKKRGATDLQEVPVIFGNPAIFRMFATYTGSYPWKWGQYTIYTLPPSTNPLWVYSSEFWGALIDDVGYGITLYSPAKYSRFAAMNVNGSTYMRGVTSFAIPAYGTVQGLAYLIVGNYWESRAYVYNLHSIGK